MIKGLTKALTLLLAGGTALGITGCASTLKNKVTWEIVHSPDVPQELQREVIDRVHKDIDNKNFPKKEKDQEKYFDDLRNEYQARAISIAAVQNFNLPLQTATEREQFNAIAENNIIFNKGDSLIQENIRTGEILDLTQAIKARYGNISQPRIFREDNGLYFLKGGSIYKDENGQASLIAPNLNPVEYVAKRDSVYLIASQNKPSDNILKIKKDGSGLETILADPFYSYSGIDISPDGTKAVCKASPQSRPNLMSPLHNDICLVINLANKVYVPLSFDNVGKYTSPNGPGVVSFTTDDGIVFTFKQQGEKFNRLYSAKLDLSSVPAELTAVKQLSVGNENVSSVVGRENDSVYVSDRSGMPQLYLATDAGAVKLSQRIFNGENPVLR